MNIDPIENTFFPESMRCKQVGNTHSLEIIDKIPKLDVLAHGGDPVETAQGFNAENMLIEFCTDSRAAVNSIDQAGPGKSKIQNPRIGWRGFSV